MLSGSNLPLLKIKLDETLTLCENVLNRGVDEEAVSFSNKQTMFYKEITESMVLLFSGETSRK